MLSKASSSHREQSEKCAIDFLQYSDTVTDRVNVRRALLNPVSFCHLGINSMLRVIEVPQQGEIKT